MTTKEEDFKDIIGQPHEAREELRQWFNKWTRCGLQGPHGGWPCGTCTINLLEQLGAKENKRHNVPVNRLNEVWRAIIQIRGDPEIVKGKEGKK